VRAVPIIVFWLLSFGLYVSAPARPAPPASGPAPRKRPFPGTGKEAIIFHPMEPGPGIETLQGGAQGMNEKRNADYDALGERLPGRGS
jgi:hypothetical protein